ncbi:MAG: HipA N-terminal domain-containing protein [Ignavibacteriae bacterium]|nr:HipA N-terminal domain-containing protein [Ignavibacteriota bacterium]
MRAADVYMYNTYAGRLVEDETGYTFRYDTAYLASASSQAVSLTLPLQKEAFRNTVLFPFFDGLIPEGWLLDIARENWKLDPRDRMGLLLACCRDCIGAASIRGTAGELQ